MKQKIIFLLSIILIVTWGSCKQNKDDNNEGLLLLLNQNQGETLATLPTGSGGGDSGGSGGSGGGGSGGYSIGGTVSNLSGTIHITLTAGSITENKTINSNGTYTFTNTISGNYTVTISTHSPQSFCYFPNANAQNNAAQTGNATSNVTNVDINCVGRFTLNEICTVGTNCASTGKDYIELKNISGQTLTLQAGQWYICDIGICGNSFNAANPGNIEDFVYSGTYNFTANSYWVLSEDSNSGKFTFGLSKSDPDGVYLIYKANNKYYLVESYKYTTGISHAKKLSGGNDGFFNGVEFTDNNGGWVTSTTNPPPNQTPGLPNN